MLSMIRAYDKIMVLQGGLVQVIKRIFELCMGSFKFIVNCTFYFYFYDINHKLISNKLPSTLF